MPVLHDLTAATINQTLHASTLRTANGSATGVTGFGAAKFVEVQLVVTAVTGLASRAFEVIIESSPDGTTWTPRATFTPTGSGREETILAAPVAAQLRARWTVAGETIGAVVPSITFSVTAKGV